MGCIERPVTITGSQQLAKGSLPILRSVQHSNDFDPVAQMAEEDEVVGESLDWPPKKIFRSRAFKLARATAASEIGRASCRERV